MSVRHPSGVTRQIRRVWGQKWAKHFLLILLAETKPDGTRVYFTTSQILINSLLLRIIANGRTDMQKPHPFRTHKPKFAGKKARPTSPTQGRDMVTYVINKYPCGCSNDRRAQYCPAPDSQDWLDRHFKDRSKYIDDQCSAVSPMQT